MDAAIAAQSGGQGSGQNNVRGNVLFSAQAQQIKRTMFHRVCSVAAGVCIAVWLVAGPNGALVSSAFAQSSETKPADQHPATGPETAAPPQKVNEFAEAQKLINGPAGNPECVWLGRRVVNLLWRDDLDTAFRHLDLYDRFGCPGGHIQATFRCLVLHANAIDPKAADSLNGQVHACWINPALEVSAAPPAPPAAPAAAAPNAATNH
jgi:hypothetical protein